MITANIIYRVFRIQGPAFRGSAFAFESDGREYLVTARHVVEGVSEEDEIGIFVRDAFIPLVDLDGAEIVAAIYDGALPFSEGLAAVKKKQWGYIDRDGNVVIAPRFGPVSEFKDGRALVWIDKTRMGLLAPDGRLVWEET